MSIILQIHGNLYVISLQVFTKKKQNTRMVYQGSMPPYSRIFGDIQT